MSIIKELKKQANNLLKDSKKKEKIGDAVEGVLKEVKKSVKDKNTQDILDKAIKTVDSATSTKKKNTKKETKTTNAKKKTTSKIAKKEEKKKTSSKKTSLKQEKKVDKKKKK